MQWSDCKRCPEYLCDNKQGIIVAGETTDGMLRLLNLKGMNLYAPCGKLSKTNEYMLVFTNGLYIDNDKGREYVLKRKYLDAIVEFLDRNLGDADLVLEDTLNIIKLKNAINGENVC